jgi:hypothetical protein
MRINSPIHLIRVWPLALSALALWGLIHILPNLYQDFRFSRNGAHTIGWCLDFDHDVFIDGRPYFSYAYTVGATTYGGQGLYDDQNSDMAFRNVGYTIGVMYLRKTPWISTVRAVEWNVKELGFWAIGCLIIFLGGLWLSVHRPGN